MEHGFLPGDAFFKYQTLRLDIFFNAQSKYLALSSGARMWAAAIHNILRTMLRRLSGLRKRVRLEMEEWPCSTN
jgi:hypothetical protein